MSTLPPIRIATRSSRLALWQAHHVEELLHAAAPDREVSIVHVSTLGDRDKSEPLHSLGTFGVFTREVQKVVLDGQADIAVHSLKDLPTEPVPGLSLAAVPQRGAAHDALLFPESTRTADANWEQIPTGATVGTGSLRRRAQLAHVRPDVNFDAARGNVETRIRKLDEGQFDALVLAAAGLERLGLSERIDCELQPPLMLGAVGQGALGIECRSGDDPLRELLSQISDPQTQRAVTAERTLLSELRGGCHAPIGATTSYESGRLHLQAVVLSVDGAQRLHAADSAEDPVELGRTLAEQLRSHGADEMIAAAKA